MSTIRVSRSFTQDIETVREAAEELAQELASNYGIRYSWQGNTASVSGKGVKGSLQLSDNELLVEMKLGMLASAFAPQLRKAVDDYLDKYLAEE